MIVDLYPGYYNYGVYGMDRIEARKIIMKESKKAMDLFRVDNPLSHALIEGEEYFERQIRFINCYLDAVISEDVRKSAV